MALIPRPYFINLDDDSDEENERLPEITVEESHFPWSLFGHQFAMAQDSSFEQLLKNIDNLEIYCDAPHESYYEATPSCSIDVSIEEAFHFPQKISTRLPIKLVTRQLCKIICLTISFWTYERAHDGIVFGSGICFNPKENQDEVIRNYVTSLANVIHTHLISTFQRIGVTREEYLLLKLVVLFEPFEQYRQVSQKQYHII
ncbi:hypothetical protein ANCDUO_13282 [Ancylostoma duodenale]|uniref:NR LBD domain-containing protein n=1 Tax=Ancylostoma duodenale TaxID=51022 RepID=A0A0C2GHJ4_9BILA|nr:hypothetical protein ANCDUO_13282 [Ancylostoma duodenale]